MSPRTGGRHPKKLVVLPDNVIEYCSHLRHRRHCNDDGNMTKTERDREFLEIARRRRYVGRWTEAGGWVNLAGNYDYLSMPYYLTEDFEHDGKTIVPTCKEMLDAYIPPLFLEKARLAGVAVPEFYISNGYFEPPVIVDPINPFTLKGRVVRKPGRAANIAKSLTRNYTYAVCCQELPANSRIIYFRSVLGHCALEVFREVARQVWEIFHIPVARVRVVRLADGKFLLSDISPLPFETLSLREMRYIEERTQWDY